MDSGAATDGSSGEAHWVDYQAALTLLALVSGSHFCGASVSDLRSASSAQMCSHHRGLYGGRR